MKHLIHKKSSTNWLVVLTVIVLTFSACDFNTPIRDAEYPDQVIYLPAAVGGNFVINNVPQRIGDPPFPGNPYRFVADLNSREFIVPLGVYRAGIDNIGGFTVNIASNTDTINDLIAEGDTIITLLPSSEYTMENSVDMSDGEELAKFELVVNLDFLRNNYPDNVFALGVTISSPDRETNPELSTAVIVIHTNIMVPEAGFSYSSDGEDPNTIHFSNSSRMAMNFSWDFGDGSEVSTEEDPSHTYAGSGTYSVTLTVTGVTGDDDESVITTDITIP